MARKCNAAGRALMEGFERLELKVYPDSNGIPTQGYGHTGPDVTFDNPPITEEQADTWFEEDIAEAEQAVDAHAPQNLTSNQFSALVSFTFNVGVHNFEGSGVLKTAIKGDLPHVPGHLILWNKDAKGVTLSGLTRRRSAEIVLWNTPDNGETNA